MLLRIIDDVVVHTNSLKQTTDKGFNSISVDDLFQEYLDTNPVDRCSLDRAVMFKRTHSSYWVGSIGLLKIMLLNYYVDYETRLNQKEC